MGRERLDDIRQRLGAARGRLTGAADRLSGVRKRLGDGGGAPRPAVPAPVGSVPLFQPLGPATGALDDLELNFEVLDTEDPGRAKS